MCKKTKENMPRTVENNEILLSTGNNDYDGHKTINQFGSLHFSYRWCLSAYLQLLDPHTI